MADLTYLQLKARIKDRLNRDDLDTIIADVSAELIDTYKSDHFYAGQVSDESITTADGTKLYNFPSGWEDVHTIQFLQGSVWLPLERKDYNYINSIDLNEPGIKSIPSMWAPLGEQLRLYPTPNSANKLKLWMELPSGPPADANSNFWTKDGKWLVIAGTVAEICEHYINDPVKADRASRTEQKELIRLGAKTIRLSGGIQVRPYF